MDFYAEMVHLSKINAYKTGGGENLMSMFRFLAKLSQRLK